MPPLARAAITATGDIEPGNPATWTTSTDGYVGYSSGGTLAVNAGSVLTSRLGTIGSYLNSAVAGAVAIDGAGSTWSNSGVEVANGALTITNGGAVTCGYAGIAQGRCSGTVTVDGAGSTWTINANPLGGLCIGNVGSAGNGTLNITNGGAVSAAGNTQLSASNTSSAGTINFGANGGTLTTDSLYASPVQVTGTGTINAFGLVSDTALVINSTGSLKQTIQWSSQPSQNVTINLDLSTPAKNGDLGAGYTGSGSLTIQNGIAVTSNNGLLGYNCGSTGTATIDGAGSTWTIGANGSLCVGYCGAGVLKITNGGTVSGGNNSSAGIGGNVGASGTAAVDGTGSTWTVGSGGLWVGQPGGGTLAVTNGGKVSSTYFSVIGYGGVGTASVDGPGSALTDGGARAS